MPRVLRLAVVLWVFGLVSSEASAVMLAYDGFVYPPGPLPGNNGGSGFAAPWNGDASVVVQPGVGLSKAIALTSSGAMIGGQFNANRSLSAAISTTTFWASFETKSDPGNDQVWLGFDVAATPSPVIAFGRRLDNYFIQNGSNPAVTVCCASLPGVTDLLVARIIRGGGTTSVDLWVNKTPTGPPTLSTVFGGVPAPSVVNTQVQSGIFSDEIRIGTTPTDVAAAAGVPLPAWAIAVSGALLLLVALRAVRRTEPSMP